MEIVGSPKWFRSKWNRLEHLKKVEDEWVGVFTEKVENEILEKQLKLDQKINYGKKK